MGTHPIFESDFDCLTEMGRNEAEFESPALWVLIVTYLNYGILTLFGWCRDLLRFYGFEKTLGAQERPSMSHFAPLYQSIEGFYTRNVYNRLGDAFCRPICSVAGATCRLMERVSYDSNWSFHFTGKTSEVINVGSYNYLGFSENTGECAAQALVGVDTNSGGTCSSRAELGALAIHRELESRWSRFLGVEATLTFGMGFATNSLNIPALVGPGSLILSDELNHASLILGCRLSGAKIKVYRHNDMKNLEDTLVEAIIHGQERTRRAYKKILIVVEGIYSMEGSVVNLVELIRIKKRYGAYLYLDEAHSIGALGASGRGVTEHFGVDPTDVDIMMGTFTKSFGAAGGYISGSKDAINHLRLNSHGHVYAGSMAAGVVAQINATIVEMDEKRGKMRSRQLVENTRHFRARLKSMGLIVFGDDASPVVPMMIYMPSKLLAFSRLMTENGIACVVVGFPATPIVSARVRFCLSASHTREQLDYVLGVVDKLGSKLALRHSNIHNNNCIKSKCL